MTETSPLSTQTCRDDSLYRRTATVGTVHPHVEIAVVDPITDQTVARGEIGELRVRGYSVMHGYWNHPEATAAAIDASGWMHTGDLAAMDADGYVSIMGRIKDMIIRGGENIYPSEIENALGEHPDVHTVQVVGVPDEKYGEQVMAWVQAHPGAAIDPEEIKNHCRARLAHYKVPRFVHLMEPDEQFPMTVTGKVQKNELRKRAADLINP